MNTPTISAPPATPPRPAAPTIPCSWAACRKPAIRYADGWWHCRPHFREHEDEFAAAPRSTCPPKPKRAPASNWQLAWDIITSNPGPWTLDEVLARGRGTDPICHHRQWLMHRIRTEAHLSLPQIGRLFGGRDHSTVLTGIRSYQRRQEQQQAEAA